MSQRNWKLRNNRDEHQASDTQGNKRWRRADDLLTPSPSYRSRNSGRTSGSRKRRNREPAVKKPCIRDLREFPHLPSQSGVHHHGWHATPEVESQWTRTGSSKEKVDDNVEDPPRFRRRLDLDENNEDQNVEGEAEQEGQEKSGLSKEAMERREKDIKKGKDSDTYRRYLSIVPYYMRAPHHPVTPNKDNNCSRRSWDMQVRIWRMHLHKFDEPIRKEKISWKNSKSSKKGQELKKAYIKAKLAKAEARVKEREIELEELKDFDLELDARSEASVSTDDEGEAETWQGEGDQERKKPVSPPTSPPPPTTPLRDLGNNQAFTTLRTPDSKSAGFHADLQPTSPHPSLLASTPNPPSSRQRNGSVDSSFGMRIQLSSEEEEEEEGRFDVVIQWSKSPVSLASPAANLSPASPDSGSPSFHTAKDADASHLETNPDKSGNEAAPTSGSPPGTNCAADDPGARVDDHSQMELAGERDVDAGALLEQLNISSVEGEPAPEEASPGVTSPRLAELEGVNESSTSWYSADLDEYVDMDDFDRWSTMNAD